jgi:hypothetical protein
LRGTPPWGTPLPHRPDLTDSQSNHSAKLREFFRREMILAKRRGSWFRLGRVERSVYALALRVEAKFESAALLRAMVSALKKMKEGGGTLLSRYLAGVKAAWAFSEAAVSWGNPAAKEWRHDPGYIEYLGTHSGSFWGRRR